MPEHVNLIQNNIEIWSVHHCRQKTLMEKMKPDPILLIALALCPFGSVLQVMYSDSSHTISSYVMPHQMMPNHHESETCYYQSFIANLIITARCWCVQVITLWCHFHQSWNGRIWTSLLNYTTPMLVIPASAVCPLNDVRYMPYQIMFNRNGNFRMQTSLPTLMLICSCDPHP